MSTPAPTLDATGYPELFQAMVAVGRPLGRGAALEFARAMRLGSPDGSPWSGPVVSEVIDYCLQRNFLERVQQGFTPSPSHALAALTLAVQSGRLTQWCDGLLRELKLLDNHQHQVAWVPASDVIAGLRIAIYSGQFKHAEKLFTYLHQYEPAEIYRMAFVGHINATLIDTIDKRYRHAIAAHLLPMAIQNPDAGLVTLIDWGVARIEANDAQDSLKYGTLRHLLWRGQFARFEQLLGNNSSEDALFLRADRAVMQGEYAQALELYDAGIELARDGGKARFGLMPQSSAWFRVAAMIASDDPTLLESRRRHRSWRGAIVERQAPVGQHSAGYRRAPRGDRSEIAVDLHERHQSLSGPGQCDRARLVTQDLR